LNSTFLIPSRIKEIRNEGILDLFNWIIKEILIQWMMIK